MLLEKLSNEAGVSGDEGAIRKIIIPAIKPHVDRVTVDTMGNVYAYKGNAPDMPTVMIAAHMDEVGVIITKINDSGMLKFELVGSFDRRILPGKRVRVGKDKIPGVIGLKAIHFVMLSKMSQSPSLESMAIDVGLKPKGISLGDFAVFDVEFGHLNSDPNDWQKGVVKGKAIDDRAGCAILIELLKHDYAVNIVGVFTVQEELGLRGAVVASQRIEPDIGIALDCTSTDDVPFGQKKGDGYPCLGDGPVLVRMDKSFIADRKLFELVESVAKKHDIPYQYTRPGVGSTDSGAINRSNAGVPVMTISIPSRYLHSPISLMELTDFWQTTKLMKDTLNELGVRRSKLDYFR